MASSERERVPLSCAPLDKWTTREQLCLASAVSCSGDQNWMSVSRTLKLLCGNGSSARPADWFSQKNCAVQYGHMLENVETPKRKKRSSESGSSSPAVVETPTDSILRRLKEERITELKQEIRKQQEEYAQIWTELKTLHAGQWTQEQLREMCKQIEQEQRQQEEAELKSQQLREQQQRREMQRNWKTIVPGVGQSTESPVAQKPAADTSVVDMDVDDIIGVNATKPTLPNLAAASQQQQQQSPAQAGTSPLLSSLLKSPTAGGNVPVMGSPANTVRATAPTITTLLTSGSIPNANQPALIIRNTVSPNTADQILKRPISGPPSEAGATGQAAQNLLSPSQAAPTISMLLEKTKAAASSSVTQAVTTSVEEKLTDVVNVAGKDSEVAPASDANHDEVPMELEENIATKTVSPNAELDSYEPDPNEEQQLLEVFKNIGNIDELDIDVAAVIDDGEVDFLKGVDEESPHGMSDGMEFDTKGDTEALDDADIEQELAREETKNDKDSKDFKPANELEFVKVETNETAAMAEPKEIKKEGVKPETTSSDDSNDNIPLAAVASLEHKAAQEKEFLKEKVESAIKNDNAEEQIKLELTTAEVKEEVKYKPEKTEDGEVKASEAKNMETVEKSPAMSENSDVIVIPTDDDDSSEDKQKARNEQNAAEDEKVENKTITDEKNMTTEKAANAEEGDNAIAIELNENSGTSAAEALAPPAPTISIADTDEDSSATDTSNITRKDDKPSTSTSKNLTPHPRKSLHDSRLSAAESKTDEESLTTTTVTPARPPMLRKLRDRDRSESPMIENDVTNMEQANTQRQRRRYSSTPVADSVPNSPASSDRDRDDMDIKMSKKSLLSIYHSLQHSKNAAVLQRSLQEDNHTPKYEEICLRPMDLPMIKKSIESGNIRTVLELQRDFMLMGQNSLMLFKENSTPHKAAVGFLRECHNIREFMVNPNTSENPSKTDAKDATKESNGKTTGGSSSSSSGVKVRSGSRKSLRIS